jgi:hypothetical protein
VQRRGGGSFLTGFFGATSFSLVSLGDTISDQDGMVVSLLVSENTFKFFVPSV